MPISGRRALGAYKQCGYYNYLQYDRYWCVCRSLYKLTASLLSMVYIKIQIKQVKQMSEKKTTSTATFD